jgi:alanyl-tRNA synthetase
MGTSWDLHEPFLYRLVPNLNSIMGHAYPELLRAEALIAESILLGGEALPGTCWSAACICWRRRPGKLEPWGRPCTGRLPLGCTTPLAFPLDLTTDVLRAKGLRG